MKRVKLKKAVDDGLGKTLDREFSLIYLGRLMYGLG
jgi:hypothetical protein